LEVEVRNIISNCVSPSPSAGPLAPYIAVDSTNKRGGARPSLSISLNFSAPTVLLSERHRHCGSNPAPIARIPPTAFAGICEMQNAACDAAIEKIAANIGAIIMRVLGVENLSDIASIFSSCLCALDHGVDETRRSGPNTQDTRTTKMPIFSCNPRSFSRKLPIRRKR